MKRSIIIIAVAMAFVVAGCHRNTKTTENDVKKAEEALFSEGGIANDEAVPDAIATFSKFAEENPGDAKAPEYLFKALEISVNTKQDPQQSIGFCNRLLTDYPQFDKNPVALFMLATFVYDEQLHDLDKARAAYQQVMDQYPDSPFAKDAAIAITQLGMTPEELIKMFESQEKSEDRSQE